MKNQMFQRIEEAQRTVELMSLHTKEETIPSAALLHQNTNEIFFRV